jgi:trans-2,3-dihydro-3-hydroxyanthranilate isomerase
MRVSAHHLPFHLVDVFAPATYSGNPLPVVMHNRELDGAQMLRIAREFRQFETVFLAPLEQTGQWEARVFDLVEELAFAGHPLLGAAAVLHSRGDVEDAAVVTLMVGSRPIQVVVDRFGGERVAWLDAGVASHGPLVTEGLDTLARAFGLEMSALHKHMPVQTISTGLRYLIMPVESRALASAAIARDLTPLLKSHGADYAVLVDPRALEIRHWSNDGRMEDFATGSAASVVAAYLARHAPHTLGEPILLSQGRYAGRISQLFTRVRPGSAAQEHIHVGGTVRSIGDGYLRSLPT